MGLVFWRPPFIKLPDASSALGRALGAFAHDADMLGTPLGDVIAVNLDHYRLDADFKHGMHFTALPTPWVSGFDKAAILRIGSSTAWTSETVGASAGFLEYTGQGLKTFERALDRDERLMSVLGARLLESQKKVGETAEAIELRQSGENSILGNLALSVSASLTQLPPCAKSDCYPRGGFVVPKGVLPDGYFVFVFQYSSCG